MRDEIQSLWGVDELVDRTEDEGHSIANGSFYLVLNLFRTVLRHCVYAKLGITSCSVMASVFRERVSVSSGGPQNYGFPMENIDRDYNEKHQRQCISSAGFRDLATRKKGATVQAGRTRCGLG